MPKPRGERAVLLKAICDEPEEDTPRLVYADWLDEHAGSEADRARAEFIRLQVAEEAARPRTWRECREWAKREKELYRAHRLAWEAELPEHPQVFIITGTEYAGDYKRGFPYFVSVHSAPEFLKAAPDLFTRVPVTDFGFRNLTREAARQLARSPHLARIRHFHLPEDLTDEALEGLAGSPHLGNLTTVTCRGWSVTANGLRPFLASPALTRLRRFHATNCGNVGPGVVAAVAGSPAATLEGVYLRGTGIGPDAAPDLPALLRLPRLGELDVSANRLGDEGAKAVAGVTTAGPVQIDLEGNGITDRGAKAILSGPLLRSPGVRLNLEGGNPITDRMKARLKDAFGDRVAV
jgi:uncharacterized protein (TIGR02996 family)